MTSHAQIANAARPTDRRLLQSFTPSTASLFEVRSLSVWMTVDETSVTQMATAGSVERQIARVEGVEVLDGSGRRVHGKALLSTVRASYA